MKLSTRIKISYLLVCVLPVVLILAMVIGIARITLDTIQEEYGLDTQNYQMILDPESIQGHVAASTIDKLEDEIRRDPDKLLDEFYLDSVNEELKNSNSFIVVVKGSKVVYYGLPEWSNVPGESAAETETGTVRNAASSGSGEGLAFQRQEISLSFSDGEEGSVYIYTDFGKIMHQIETMVLRALIGAVLIMFIVCAFVMLWLYHSIVRPLGKLKNAAENITAGNLDVSIMAESCDEIGELCDAFEAMRLKLKSQVEQNIRAEKDSKELISNISHDLKTPMTSIKGYVEGLRDGVADTPEKREKYIRTIYNKVNDMDSLIEELFLYAKLDSNSVTYSFVKLNVSDYFQDCAEEIGLDLEAQGIDFGYYNYIASNTVVIADPEQLKRVINNIVGNSVKYAYPGRPLKISMRIVEEAEFVKVEIEDNGRGIARREVPLIFDRLYRTDASRNSTKGGSGLGLSIAKKIIEEHGGKIWAMSTEGQGTTMYFVLRKYKEPEVNAAPDGTDDEK